MSEGGEYQVYPPKEEGELMVRYFEYVEGFDLLPDKLKHWDYICAVEDQELKMRFFHNTHRFKEFRPTTWRA